VALTVAQKIAANTKYQKLLGWTLPELGIYEQCAGAELVEAIADVQARWLKFPAAQCDGIAGPATYRAALLAYIKVILRTPHKDLDDDTAATDPGRVAVMAGIADWCLDIVDAPASSINARSRTYIDETVRSHLGANWTWEAPYRGNGDIEWCGMFAARIAAHAGLRLDIRTNFMPSTYRLDRFFRYQRATDKVPNPKPGQGPFRMIVDLDEDSSLYEAKFPDGTAPRAGDILLVGGMKSAYGTHVATIAGPAYADARQEWWLPTIEGNATGPGPTGKAIHGVIKTARRIGLPDVLKVANPQTYHARRMCRFAPSDYQ
jgi:hypothetical protein